MTSTTWKQGYAVKRSEHMELLHELTQCAEGEMLEFELYSPHNLSLSYIAAVRSKGKTRRLTVAPQYELHPPMFRDPASASAVAAGSGRALRSSESNPSSLAELSISTSRTEETAVTSNASISQAPKASNNNFRKPDFITFVTRQDNTRRVVMIHEVKPFPRILDVRDEPGDISAQYNEAFDAADKQVLDLAKYAFETFDQDFFFITTIVGMRFVTRRYDRKITPKLRQDGDDDYEDKDDPEIKKIRKKYPQFYTTCSTMHDILNNPNFLRDDFRDFAKVDYSDDYKTWYTKAINMTEAPKYICPPY
ncbi:hypothetical protein B0H21DRAFT_77098 [Amylocystis lapponica]|nr:hypothetical protein B0H21DRAFT_759982 [Amylocystis lapponica]KAH9934599.1 hypothetical protein B0H21DRAFT_77098 [Amylocystis lapponica]